MKKYSIKASYITYVQADIEAESEQEAWDKAKELDGGDFYETEYPDDWSIDEVIEKDSEATK